MKTEYSKKCIRKTAVILFWIVVWQFISAAFRNSLALASPLEVAGAFLRLLPTAEFWSTVLRSLVRILIGFVIAFTGAVGLGSAAYASDVIRELLDPVMSMMKAVPVASFVILALIVIGSDSLTFLIVFLVVFPVVYMNTLTGLKNTDDKLLEMANVFHIGGFRRIFYIYRPAIAPYLISACRISLGMSFKSGAAAEVIGVPAHSIGEKLYLAKIYLETADLFAWTITIIVLSMLCEIVITWILKKVLGEGGHEA